MVNTRSLNDVSTNVALTGEQLKDLIREAVAEKTAELYKIIDSLRKEVTVLKESNVDMIKLLSSKGSNITVGANKSKSEKITSKPANPNVLSYSETVASGVTRDKILQSPSAVRCDRKSRIDKSENINNTGDNKPKNLVIGKAEPSLNGPGFCAIQKRAWLYVGRVALGTENSKIKNYLTEKFPNSQFEVEQLPKRDDARSIAFKVGADIELIDELYKGENWPAGVFIKQFRFFRRQQHAQF
uniref:Uncharacterized protein n=1 Tax=Photinus pyralis TaxID=7054 RepID=A0A1Y1NJF7_PHOPY